MATLLLHIGRSKTGSTAVQDFLRANVAGLRKHGVRVPTFLKDANHAEIALAHAGRPGRVASRRAVVTTDAAERLRRSLDRQLTRHVEPEDFWLFSSEHLSTIVRSPADVRALTRQLHRHFDRIEAFAFVRRPDHALPSAYSQTVQSFAAWEMDARFVHRRRRQFHHGDLADRWGAAGVDVRLVPYLESWHSHDHTAVHRALLHEVAEAGGPTIEVESLHLPPTSGTNRRLTAQGAEFVRMLNERRHPVTRQERRRLALLRGVRAMPGDPLRATSDAYRALQDLGLVYGGLDRRQHAGTGWEQWFAQPEPALADKPRLSEDDFRRLSEELLPTGVGLTMQEWIDRIARTARRVGQPRGRSAARR